MNILSHQDMIKKEKELLHLYNQNDIKFKLNLSQLIDSIQNHKDFLCFSKLQSNVHNSIKKLVPLSKKVKTLKLEEEQNGLFKLIVYIFLLMIYKNRNEAGQYLKEHLKCSLYSDDFELLQVRNHSFNKKMKSDIIKSVIAHMFKEVQYLMQTEIIKKNKIKPEELVAFALQQNDIVVEGFHLFYRNILAKLDVQNANNCLEDVDPYQALENLIEFFEIDCRIFDRLYFFSDAGIFISFVDQNVVAFGGYYQNQLAFQQTLQEETQQKPNNKDLQLNLQKKLIPADNEIDKNDVKIFNFILDTDRSSSYMQQSINDNKSHQAVTPSFQQNDQLKFGKKSDRGMQNSLNKIKDRIQKQKINEISSEEEQIQIRQQITQSFNEAYNKRNYQQNKFLNLVCDDSVNISQSDAAPTPILGGNQIFKFGNKIQQSNKISNSQQGPRKEETYKKSNPVPSVKTPSNNLNPNILIETKDIKQQAIRRQSYQGVNSSQSKSSDIAKKTQMKTSKNQIKVIDQTASRASVVNNSFDMKTPDDIFNARKVTMAYCEQTSSFSNCTCHLQKKAKFKLSSQIISMSLNLVSENQETLQNFGRHVTNEIIPNSQDKISSPSYKNDSKKNFFQKINNNSSNGIKNDVKKEKSPQKQPKQHQKSQQFINFLKKDKTQLIKKLTEKRNAKNQIGSGQIIINKFTDQEKNSTQPNRRFVKQSMFVGSYNFQNPQKLLNGKLEKNHSTSPHYSIDKNMKKIGDVRDRSKTPPNRIIKKENDQQSLRLIPIQNNNFGSPHNQNHFIESLNSKTSKIVNQKINFLNPNMQKPQISIVVPIPTKNSSNRNNNFTPINGCVRNFQQVLKK